MTKKCFVICLCVSGLAGRRGFILVLCDLRQQDRSSVAAGKEDRRPPARLTAHQTTNEVQVSVFMRAETFLCQMCKNQAFVIVFVFVKHCFPVAVNWTAANDCFH